MQVIRKSCSYLVLSFVPCVASAQTTERVSVSTLGAEGNALSNYGSISADGRYVVFQSDAGNLVPGDTNNVRDIFLRDRATGLTSRISVGPGGVQADGESAWARISSDGSTIAFSSVATNLTASPTPPIAHIFAQDRITGAIECVSVDSAGTFGDQPTETGPALSRNGRFVAFTSSATNLVPNDTNGTFDVFVHDRSLGTTLRASVDSAGNQSVGGAIYAAISGDGRFVAFNGSGGDLVLNDGNLAYDSFVHDLRTGQTTCQSVTASGSVTTDTTTAGANYIAISDDGRFVGFSSHAADLVPGDTNGRTDAFVRDRLLGTTSRVSVTSSGAQALQETRLFDLSADGRAALLWSSAPLVPEDTNGGIDAYLHDAVTGTVTRVGVSSTGGELHTAAGFSVSANARYVVFMSTASAVPGDANQAGDVFVRDVTGYDPPTVICAGDGGGTACPCANAGVAWHGCSNSSVAGGAQLVSTDFASVGADTFQLDASGLPASSPALYFQGTASVNGGAGAVFGDGLRCAGGITTRLGVKTSIQGESSFGQPAGDVPISVLGSIPAAGGTYTYQVQYRDAPSYCTPSTFNLSNALVVTWVP